MKYAIIEITGKQFTVEPGQKIVVDRLGDEVGESITIDTILLMHDGTDVTVGTPYIPNATLSAKVLEHSKGEKIRVAKFKAKSKYRKVRGHRQYQTTLEIMGDKKAEKKVAAPKKEAKATEKKVAAKPAKKAATK